MAPNKNQKPNAFMVFTLEWKSKCGREISTAEATQLAGEIWKNMDADQRAPYKERAKEAKMLFSRSAAEKLTSTGVPVSQIEKERRDQEDKEFRMKRDIESTVKKSVNSDKLEKQSYYFIMVNYFTKTLKGGVYVPAELAICKFSLQDGVSRVYHTLINPGVNIYGHQYEAQHHADNTHNLPLPPSALGDKNLGNIYNQVLDFVRDPVTKEYAPIYTHRDCIHIVESVLDFLKADTAANNIDLKVYPIQYLFFIMKEATCDVGEVKKPGSFYITDAYFERDFFEYQIGIGCQFHEDIDKCKYCTQSYVTRWGYMFCDYMCGDLAIRMEPGRHCPINTNLNAIVTPAPSRCNDNESFVSMSSMTSAHTNPVAGSAYYLDDQKTSVSVASKTYTEDYPSLGARGAKKKTAVRQVSSPVCHKSSRMDNISSDGGDTDLADDDLNPWNSRSRQTVREPESTHFDIDYNNGLNSSDTDEFNSVASFGRGRGSLVNSCRSTTSSHGRGRYFRH
ncbi:protein maelstrom 1-like [Haematobia irritans]|uniref:protein maelstrom 1-like n=1 Tax=Haematobia irritans TaxID=7368 RepID=UPI003F50682F